MKTLKINGVDFEIINSRKYPVTKENIERYIANYSGKDLLSYYNRPSYSKQYIWNNWKEWCNNSHFEKYNYDFVIDKMQVASANCMLFTIDAVATEISTGKQYMLYITRDHNRAYPVV